MFLPEKQNWKFNTESNGKIEVAYSNKPSLESASEAWEHFNTVEENYCAIDMMLDLLIDFTTNGNVGIAKFSGFEVRAVPDTGYKFKEWKKSGYSSEWVASFELAPITLTFQVKCSSDSSKEETKSYSVLYGTEMEVITNSTNMFECVMYDCIEDTIFGGYQNETYNYYAPEDWAISNVTPSGRWFTLLEDTTVTITIVYAQYSITFSQSPVNCGHWENAVGETVYSSMIKDGDTLRYSLSSEYQSADIYVPYVSYGLVYFEPERTDMVISKLVIKANNTTYTFNRGSSGEITIHSDVEVIVHMVDVTSMYEVTFAEVPNATLSAPKNPIMISPGDSITATEDAFGLTYTYNNTVVASYYKDDIYYIILNDEDKDEIINANDLSDLTIAPVFTLYYCYVTMDNSYSDIAGLSDSEPFVVEYGTTIEFGYMQYEGVFAYHYDFKKDGTIFKRVTYTMKSDKYAMNRSYDNEGKYVNGLELNIFPFAKEGKPTITIKPEFGLKQYGGDFGGQE